MAKVKSKLNHWIKGNKSEINGKLTSKSELERELQLGTQLSRRGSSVKDFYRIRNECLERGHLWEDSEFEANDSSIYYRKRPSKPVVWKRPFEIVREPKFFVEGVSRFDVKQGALGDCWLMSSLANHTLSPPLFQKVVPKDQSFTDQYAGVFHFRFWRFGTWIEVVVDDRLPTSKGKLIYINSTSPDEFWSALLEKAYAKMFGSYEALSGGNASEAMVDFTGGILEMYSLKNPPTNVFQMLYKAYERRSLMTCSIDADLKVVEKKTPEGLIMGHVYSVTRVHKMNVVTPEGRGQLSMLRLRNPWGEDDTWNGPWSDKSPEWANVPKSEKERIRMSIEKDGEFWMSCQDFMTYFDRLEICNLTPDSLVDEDEGSTSSNKRWDVQMAHGEWVAEVTAGGCRNYLETFWRNPQYRIKLTEVDDEDDDTLCTVVISLIQKNRRILLRRGIGNLAIGFVVYRLENHRELPTPLDKDFFKNNRSVARSPSFVNRRQVCSRLKLPPGDYCIVPSTYNPNQEGEFLLRVFSEKKNSMVEHDNEVEYVGSEMLEDTTLQSTGGGDGNFTGKVMEHFIRLRGVQKEINWLELKEILDHAMQKEALSKGGFSKDICRSMIAMSDSDVSGRLNMSEFVWLWRQICSLKMIYHRFRESPQGRLRTSELKEALAAAGYKLNAQVLNMLARRYAGRDGKIPIDDFMMCAIKLNTMINYFNQRDENKTNKAEFTLQKWIILTVGC